MIRRSTTILLLALATVAVACIDMSAPKGAASISQMQLPSGYVVRGDVMRDSAGAPAKLGVLAYDGNGNVLADAGAQFFITDSAPAAHFDSSGVLVGDRLGSIRVIGQIGNLQTPATFVYVTVAPTKIVAGPPIDTLRVPLAKDSTGSIKGAQLAVSVRGIGDTAVQGVLVHFKVTRTLESTSNTPAVYLGYLPGKIFSVDTTASSGSTGHEQLFVFSRSLADQALQSGQKVDSVIVEASATYKGAPLLGSPVRLVIPVRVVPAF